MARETISITEARLIEDWVSDILRQFESLRGEAISLPVPIFEIAQELMGFRCDIEELKGSLSDSSGIVILAKRWVILNSEQSKRRMAFTLAHELAHWLIEFQEHRVEDHGLERITGLRSKKEYVREARADYVAGAFLVPKETLLEEVHSLHGVRGPVSDLAAMFGVSSRVMEIRLRQLDRAFELGLLSQLSRGSNQALASSSRGAQVSETRKAKLAIVKVQGSVFDHSLYRSLTSLKQRADRLYLAVPEDRPDSSEILIYLDCIDGLAFLDDEMIRDLQEDRGMLAEDIVFHTLDSSFWVDRLQRGGSCGRDHDPTEASVAAFRNNGRLHLKQRSLIDISRYIKSPVELNYRNDARAFVKSEHQEGNRVVIATGCFDLLTVHHVRFLKRAKEHGDTLVVGIEDDTRVRAFKGPLRPVNAISQRVEVINALEFVDYTFVISGSPRYPIKPFYTRLHSCVGADILAVTEGDPHLEDRRDEIEAAGGELRIASPHEDGSSTSLLRRFLSNIEISDLLLVSKQRYKDYLSQRETNWRQLRLPL